MTAPDDLKVYEAICEAEEGGLTTDELAERFGMSKWVVHDACLRLRDGPEQLVTSGPRRGSSLIAWFRKEPDPPWKQHNRRSRTIEPFI